MTGRVFRFILELILLPLLVWSCSRSEKTGSQSPRQYDDTPFIQDYSVKFVPVEQGVKLLTVHTDRNKRIQVLTSAGLFHPSAGEHLYPGKLVPDSLDRQTSAKKIRDVKLYDNQYIYLDDKAVFSNGWAGRLYCRHNLENAVLFEPGHDFTFLVSDGNKLELINDSGIKWEGDFEDQPVKDIQFDASTGMFWILGLKSVSRFDPVKMKNMVLFNDNRLTCIEASGKHIIAGTSEGYLLLDRNTGKPLGEMITGLPVPFLTVVREIKGHLWFGSGNGAFMLRDDGKFNYYSSGRWLPSDNVIDISGGPDNSVLIVTGTGLAQICYREMTLYEKALYYENQVRLRHIRHGFNATLGSLSNGNLQDGSMADSDNDGLWTSMYLAAEAFRYAVTGEEYAFENVRESLDAMERLFTINSLSGFPSRSFMRRGYKYDEEPWKRAMDHEWDWKSTTSSDEAIGHIFAYGVIAEVVSDNTIKGKAVALIDSLMSHILKNNLYLIDWNGEPTKWGRWNPEYVNSFPEMVGDRKLNSSNIISMLQTAYYFTGKEKYREAAFDLMQKHSYFQNLMRPMKDIGKAPPGAGELAAELSEEWNHSDDEMYYCGYWGLYRYAFNDTLRDRYREAILDHWEKERPEKEGLWNIMTAITGTENFDLGHAAWYLREYPLDLIDWTIRNSHRRDISFVAPNFRNQTITEVLPPDELRISRHNSNRFILDSAGGGRSEYSAGDIWLLPYWMGRYLGIISPYVSK